MGRKDLADLGKVKSSTEDRDVILKNLVFY